jgi:hypothetical protein
LQFLIAKLRIDGYGRQRVTSLPAAFMNSSVHFVELDNRIITATYRNLMVKAKVVLVDQASGQPLPDTVSMISSPLPASQLRIRLPDSVKAGLYVLQAFNAHGEKVAQSAAFEVP